MSSDVSNVVIRSQVTPFRGKPGNTIKPENFVGDIFTNFANPRTSAKIFFAKNKESFSDNDE